MLTDPKNTLAFHQARFTASLFDKSDIPASFVAKPLEAVIACSPAALVLGEVAPERDAIVFYMLNHVASFIRGDRHELERLSVIEQAMMASYHHHIAMAGTRAFFYLLAICIRESRHANHPLVETETFSKHHGAAIGNFHIQLKGHDEMKAIMRFCSQPPACTIGEFTRALAWGFRNMHYHGSFGGAPWANIADCLDRYVHGQLSAEMMVDTVYTLAHNNGPIFNKGMLYQHHSPLLIRILDLQRSGQMIEAAMLDGALQAFLEGRDLDLIESVFKNYGHRCNPYIDWFQVQLCGALGSYAAEQEKQVQQHGPSQSQHKVAAMIAAKTAKDELAAAELQKSSFVVMPGVTVPKVFRKEAA